MRWAGLLFVGVAASALAADLRTGTIPPFGREAVATVGATVFERFQYKAKPAARLLAPIFLQVAGYRIDIPAGEVVPLGPPIGRSVSGCTKIPAAARGDRDLDETACLHDKDNDGRFERVAVPVFARATLNPPVPYELAEDFNPVRGDFRQSLTFLGVSGNTLRLNYREFANGLARAPYTEELTFPLAATFPQEVAFRDIRLTIIAVDGTGMRYTVTPSSAR